MMGKVDPCLFMSKTVICVVYVDACLFWARSQYEIDNVMKYFKDDGPSYNWIMVDFSFIKLDLSAKSWKPQGWIMVMGCQHPPRLRNLLEQT